MKGTIRLKFAVAAVPYIAVVSGLYVFSNAWAAILLYHFGIVLFMIIDGREKLLKNIRSGWNSTAAGVCVAICVLIGPFIVFFWQHMRLEGVELETRLMEFGLCGLSWYVFVVYFSTVQPFLEELFWRGYFGNEDRFLPGIDIVFGGYHVFVLAFFIKLPWLIVSLIVISCAGWGWRFIANKCKGLIVPLLSHIAADISIIIAINILIW